MIQAIETRYAGCKFRSRLEARWAVFFNEMGIRWQYEPEGLMCSARLTGDDEGVHLGSSCHAKIPYLPDFWFPDLKLYGEVKGSLTHHEMTRLLNIAASLSSNDGGGCRDNDGSHDLIVFGNIPPRIGPAEHEGRLPTRLHMHKGGLNASGWSGAPDGCVCGEEIAADYGGDPEIYVLHPHLVNQWLTKGSWASSWTNWRTYQSWDDAYDIARSARFEHGQSGT